jgi:hypothetical protein
MKKIIFILSLSVFAACGSGSVNIKTDSAIAIKGDSVIEIPHDSTKKVSDSHNNSGLRTAMNNYDRLILKTNGDSIALLYTIDGDLGNMAHGRDSIRKFLYRYKDFKVLEQVSTIDLIRVFLDTGFITGSYRQKVIVPNNNARDTVSVKGNFQSTWIMVPDFGWQIKKMETQPAK